MCFKKKMTPRLKKLFWYDKVFCLNRDHGNILSIIKIDKNKGISIML